MRHRNTPSGELTFEHTAREGFEVVATCEFDAGDRSVGIWPGWFLVEATVADAVILDRDAFARYLGSRELDKVEEHAGDLYEDMAADGLAEQQAARDEDSDDRGDW